MNCTGKNTMLSVCGNDLLHTAGLFKKPFYLCIVMQPERERLDKSQAVFFDDWENGLNFGK